MFWANRLLPMAMRGRAQWEVHVLFLIWAAAIVVTLVQKPQRTWTCLFALTGVSLLLLPIFNLVGTRWNALSSLIVGDLLPLGVDATMLAFGGAYLWLARRVAHYVPHSRKPRRARPVPTARPMQEVPA